jgi:hypothetical protein
VISVSSSFFDDARLFSPGSAAIDCALLMREIPVTWSVIQPTFQARRPSRAGSPTGPRNTARFE